MNIVSWFRFYRNAKGVWAYLHDATVGKWQKRGVIAMIIFTVIYAISPFDFIPDFLAPAIWFVAFLDDLGFMALCFLILNQIGMKYAETHQLPAAPSKEQLPADTLPTP